MIFSIDWISIQFWYKLYPEEITDKQNIDKIKILVWSTGKPKASLML
jgi:hypothetical protein